MKTFLALASLALASSAALSGPSAQAPVRAVPADALARPVAAGARPDALAASHSLAASRALVASRAFVASRDLVASRDRHRRSSAHGRGYGPSRHWVPGCHETVHERVWVPGGYRRRWIEPAYETRFDACGNAVRVLVRAGHFTVVYEAGRYEVRPRRVWRAGHWELGYASRDGRFGLHIGIG